MGRLDELVEEVNDPRLRKELRSALAESKRKQKFGLVFEEHIPETTTLLGLPLKVGSEVQRRDGEGNGSYRVLGLMDNGKLAKVVPKDGGKPETVLTKDLLVIKRFGEPIYPALSSLGGIKRGKEKPSHAVIDGENYHALQLLIYLFERQVDCIYLDPPFNTGARDWKYNNRYVDAADTWRHSKWLSFMEKRLHLAKRLLRKDGVVICAIDEHEVHHLGMLLERIFPEYLRYMITIVNNPKGTGKANFARVEEYAFFVVPNAEVGIVKARPLEASLDTMITGGEPSDLGLAELNEVEEPDDAAGETEEEDVEQELEPESRPTYDIEKWEGRHARRRGAESSYRFQRPDQFYPIYINEQTRKVVRIGQALPLEVKPQMNRVDGLRPIWPIDGEGRERVWIYFPKTMQERLDQERIVLGRHNIKRDTWTVKVLFPLSWTRKLKTVWVNTALDSSTHGSQMLTDILGEPHLFPFPKSVYGVKECLAAVVRDRPDALILDFFAGSGTTFHAACLLNAQDGGRRRTIQVTNNEVSEREARRLHKQGLFRGDTEFEKHGIFQQVTRPRCEAVLKGIRPDGSPIPGNHLDEKGRKSKKGRPFNWGFEENVEFFRLDYLDPDEVDLGRQFEAILPSLWLAAGGIGSRFIPEKGIGFLLPQKSPYGILLQESRFEKFRKAIGTRKDVTHVWLVTDSEEAYAEMRSVLPGNLHVSMLYRDYLRNFQITG